VKVRAQFDNADNALFPNQFVNAQLLVKTLHNVVTVPTAAYHARSVGLSCSRLGIKPEMLGCANPSQSGDRGS
jgi:hypothetical protein